MSNTAVAEEITQVAQLVRAGDLGVAKKHARALLNVADTRSLSVIIECITILETRPRIAPAKLRHFWTISDDTARAIIEACAPRPGEPVRAQVTAPAPRPRWNSYNRHEAPRDLPARRTTPRAPRPAAQRQAYQRAHNVTDTYMRERGGVDDQPQRGEQSDGYAIDYDRAALYPLRALPCLLCGVERSSADRRRGDSLCLDCHERGRTGITPPATSAAGELIARCEHHARHNHPTAARVQLRADYKRLTDRRGREFIAAWVNANRALIDAPALSAQTDVPSPCECGSTRQIRDNLCVECRQLTD
ncbi:hypothetical protein [Actinokineospora sp. HUAS TT18]|uniref:hypothetical protein n=1 Tax=Actinokineospora sp. HUAS TT18 TaxID=3447451 RepID=UPI003F52222D